MLVRVLIVLLALSIITGCTLEADNTYSTVQETFEQSGIESVGIMKEIEVKDGKVLFYQGMNADVGVGLVRLTRSGKWRWVMGGGMESKGIEPVNFSWTNLDKMNKPGDGYHIHWGSVNDNQIARLHVKYNNHPFYLDHDAELFDTGLGFRVWYVILDKYAGPIPGVEATGYSENGSVLYQSSQPSPYIRTFTIPGAQWFLLTDPETITVFIATNDGASPMLQRVRIEDGSMVGTINLTDNTSPYGFYYRGGLLRYYGYEQNNGYEYVVDWNDNRLVKHPEPGRFVMVKGIENISYGEGGIWNRDEKTGKTIKWTKGLRDGQPYWIDDQTFIYTSWTGKYIADGSGYDVELRIHWTDTGKDEVFDRTLPVWDIIGWLSPGKRLLVDGSFNEGTSVNYTDLHVVDIDNHTVKRLLRTDSIKDVFPTEYWDDVFSEKSGFVAVNSHDGVVIFDGNANVVGRIPLASQARTQYQFSPDGRKLAVLTYQGSESNSSNSAGGKLIIFDIANQHTTELINVSAVESDFTWLIDGRGLLVRDGESFGVLGL